MKQKKEKIEPSIVEKITAIKPKNERMAFKRKMVKLDELVESLKPIEDKIIQIIVDEKYPIMDQIQALRLSMIKECVHPKEYLIHYKEDDKEYVHCKFCEADISVK